MALKILLADNDVEWLKETGKFCKSTGYDICFASTGKTALQEAYNSNLYAAILHSTISNMSCIQTFKTLKGNYPSLKVVILFDSEEDKNSDEFKDFLEANKNKLSAFLKSDGIEAILSSLDSTGLGLAPVAKAGEARAEESIDCADEEFQKIKINDFFSGKAVVFDVHVKLGSGRYIKILHSGDKFEKSRIDKYKADGIEYLYYHRKDEKKFILFNNSLASNVAANKKVSSAIKINLIKNVAESFFDSSMMETFTPQSVDLVTSISSNIGKIVGNSNGLSSVLRSYSDFDPRGMKHSFAVSMFSAIVLSQFKWDSETMLENVSLAAMLHDIGKIKLDQEVAAKNKNSILKAEQEEYRKHPLLGAEIIQDIKGIPPAVLQVISQHHERIDGTGFPHGLKGKKIFLMASIVGFADELVHEMDGEKKVTPIGALKSIREKSEVMQAYYPGIFENFVKAFVSNQ